MNIKVLGIVTVALVGIATVVSQRERGMSASATEQDSGLLFPDLEARINDVARVEVIDKDGSFEVARQADSWGMPSKGGYPVDFTKVKQLVVEVSKLEKLEPKTATPAKFASLGVEDVSEPDAQGKLVRLKAADGSELAAVLIGNSRPSQNRGGRPSLYARLPDDNQSWLVEGRVMIEPEPTWLAKTIAEIGFERMAAARITHPEGEVVFVSRPSPEDKDFVLADMPEGRELRYAGVASGLARALQRLNLEDVAPREEVDFSAGPNYMAEFTTWDGLRIDVRSMDRDDKSCLQLTASYDESLRPAPAGPTAGPTAPEEGAEATEPEAAPPVGKSPEQVQAEVAELNERWSRWVYIVPGYTANNFKMTTEELLKPLPTEGDDELGVPMDLGAGAQSIQDLFPDGLPEELQGIDFGPQAGPPSAEDGDALLDELLLDESILEEPLLEDTEIVEPILDDTEADDTEAEAIDNGDGR